MSKVSTKIAVLTDADGVGHLKELPTSILDFAIWCYSGMSSPCLS